MKKAKLMLTGIIMLAVVGGALAFKANKFGSANVYCDDSTCQTGKVNFRAGSGVATSPCSNLTYFGTPANCTQANSLTLFTATDAD